MSNNHPILPRYQSRILRVLRREGPLSRWELHKRTSLRPNTVGDHVSELLAAGFLTERAAAAAGPGRPRVPVSVNTTSLHVVGAAIRPGHVEACRLNLCGHSIGRLLTQPISHPGDAIATTRRMLKSLINGQTFLVGLSTTGFVDTLRREILFSSALLPPNVASLDSLLEVTGEKPLVVDNDMHALAARWLQEHHRQLDEDVLLVYLDDGQLGSALLVRGEPNWGCIVGGNELGHTRLPVETALCYCGHTGCMERICSSEFLRLQDANAGTLLEHVSRYDGSDRAMGRLLDLLSMGLANAINFIRPHRVVIVSQFTRHGRFMEALMLAVRTRVIKTLAELVQFHYWDQAATGAGETAGWLALAAIYHPEWTKTILSRPHDEKVG